MVAPVNKNPKELDFQKTVMYNKTSGDGQKLQNRFSSQYIVQ